MGLCLLHVLPVAAQSPWEIWHDLHRLAEIVPGDQVLLRSSYCPSGCRYDRHSMDDWRYLRLDGDEGVIFEEEGAGAITRIWMTTGMGVSQPLNADVRLRVYVDGAAQPVIDLPLPDLFNGSTPPFLPPLVGDRLTSSGGNFSYVPIPYRDGCRVTLLGAHDETLWYQLSYHRLADPGDVTTGVTTFTGGEDLSGWSTLVDAAGEDPWPESGQAVTLTGALELLPGGSQAVASFTGSSSLTALRFQLDASEWDDVELRLVFDGELRVQMPLADFFAAGRPGGTPSRTLLVGVDAGNWLYAYFPMPFFEDAEIVLSRSGGLVALPVSYSVRLAGQAPSSASALFGAQLNVDDETAVGVDSQLLKLQGIGKWVGLFADLGSVGTPDRQYLEGDEHVFLDGSPLPLLHGTGTEDIFNGGFYFDQGPFQRALHGSPYHLTPNGEDVTAAYRLLLTDAVTFGHELFAGLEGGPTGDLSLRFRTTSWFYLKAKVFADGFESGDVSAWSSSKSSGWANRVPGGKESPK